MKIALTIALLFVGFSAHASSGQTYRENVAHLKEALNLTVNGVVGGTICGISSQEEIYLLGSATGEAYAVGMNSFVSEGEPDGDADTAKVQVLSDCSTKILKF